MPTTAWSVARDEISRPLGFQDFTTTTNIGAGTSVISTALTERYPEDDFFNGWHIIFETDNNAGDVRRITDYAQSTGTLTVAGPNLSSDSSSTDAALHLFNPDDIKRAYNRARQNVFPCLYAVKDLHTIVTGQIQHEFTIPTAMRKMDSVWYGERQVASTPAENVLSNEDFESWSSGSAASWTISGTGATETEEGTTGTLNYGVLEGGSSAKILSASSGAATYLQTPTPDIAVEGMEINLSVWVYSRTASRVSATILGTDVVSTPVTGATHSGSGWEKLAVSADIDSNGTSFSCGVNITAGTVITVYVDEAICMVGQSEPIDPPWYLVENWRHIASIDGASNSGKLIIPNPPPDKHQLRIVGRDILGSVSADTDTIEIDGELLEPLYDFVRSMLCQERAYRRAGEPNQGWLNRADYFDQSYQLAIERGVGVSLGSPRPFRRPDA